MIMTQCWSRARSLLVVGLLLSACDDSSDTDEQNEAAESDTAGSRAGESAATGAGRSGSAATNNNNTSAGRAGGAGQNSAAGRTATAAVGGAGNTAQQAGNSASAGTAGTAGIAASRMTLSDGEIVAVISTVNSSEIGSGTLAMERARSEAVRNYAESMVTVHDTAQARQATLATDLGLTPEPSPLSVQFGDEAVALMTQLRDATDEEFDALYLRSQIDAHMKVLMLIDEKLLPSVTAEKLRTELMLTRGEVATHLDGARNAAGTLDGDNDAGVP